MNKKLMVLASLVSALFLVSLVSASVVQDITNPSVSNIQITVTPNNSTATLYLNTAGQIWDTQNITAFGLTNYPFYISTFLEGMNFSGNLSQGNTYPTFSTISIEQGGSYTSTLLDIALSYYNYSFRSSTITPNDLTNLSQFYSQKYLNLSGQTMIGNANFSKQGDNYVISYDKGFGNDPTQYMASINNIITQYTNDFNLKNLINKYLPLVLMNANLSSYINQIGYSASVNLSQVLLKDGTYTIPVTLTSGTESATENIQLTLSGIQTETYTSSDPSVNSWVSGISNLAAGTNMNVVVLDNSSLSASQMSQLGSLTALKLINVTLTGPEQSGIISFSVPQSLISNPNSVTLYVWDTSSNSWIALSTSYLGPNGSNYLYQATTPHFSLFMIGYSAPAPTPSTTNNNGYPYPGVYNPTPSVPASTNTNSNTNSNLNNNNPNTTNLNNPSGITGGVIGALTSPGGIVFLSLLVLGVATVLVVVARRKISRKK